MNQLQMFFCFGAFADKNSGIVYHNLTGSFPLMSYKGSICVFIIYHYGSTSILATPIASLHDVTFFNANKQQFELLISKGSKPKLNVWTIKQQNTSKCFLMNKIVKCSSWSHTTIVSMRPNTQSKNVQGGVYCHACNNQQQLPLPIVGWINILNTRHSQSDARIAHQSIKIGT